MQVKLNTMDSEIAAKIYMLNSMIIKETYIDPGMRLHPGVNKFHPDLMPMFYGGGSVHT